MSSGSAGDDSHRTDDGAPIAVREGIEPDAVAVRPVGKRNRELLHLHRERGSPRKGYRLARDTLNSKVH